ncbi:hypothetical protein B0I08_101125 [Glaciihabitans tibetensis]|uniref:YCII-related domain-containing protein n=1 Tax=Glaciihabitans tibetensis TaxID=1266600 RepID=A0A2T0VIJ2_9MICO|nr:YciI family protein [Glaciihabitans tibetensis]PRY70003.1 hypothetical protein B0I08_101125 [Glaciihabitans tibetensis]
MRYSLLLNNPEPDDVGLSEEDMAPARAAFDAYARALEDAGVLVSANILQTSGASTTLTRREGTLQVQDGPFADTKDKLNGTFVIDVPDLDAALAWAEKCPAADYGVIEIRPSAIEFSEGRWNVLA